MGWLPHSVYIIDLKGKPEWHLVFVESRTLGGAWCRWQRRMGETLLPWHSAQRSTNGVSDTEVLLIKMVPLSTALRGTWIVSRTVPRTAPAKPVLPEAQWDAFTALFLYIFWWLSIVWWEWNASSVQHDPVEYLDEPNRPKYQCFYKCYTHVLSFFSNLWNWRIHNIETCPEKNSWLWQHLNPKAQQAFWFLRFIV